MKSYSAIIALFIGAAKSVAIDSNIDLEKHHHHRHYEVPESYAQINSDAFANAAVQARIDADADISNQVRHHHMVNAAAHNKAWKKHFKESEFYQLYAEHT